MNRATAPLLISILLLGSLQSIRLPVSSSSPALSQLGNSTAPARGTQTASLARGMLPRNEDGPWTALCRYFAAYDPEYFANQRRPTTNAQHEPVPLDEAIRRTIAWERANPPAEIDPDQFDYAAEDAA